MDSELNNMKETISIRLFTKEKDRIEDIVSKRRVNIPEKGWFPKYDNISHFCRCAVIALLNHEKEQ